jgi:hypothetical protein
VSEPTSDRRPAVLDKHMVSFLDSVQFVTVKPHFDSFLQVVSHSAETKIGDAFQTFHYLTYPYYTAAFSRPKCQQNQTGNSS